MRSNSMEQLLDREYKSGEWTDLEAGDSTHWIILYRSTYTTLLDGQTSFSDTTKNYTRQKH
jgi:hypothetical protein